MSIEIIQIQENQSQICEKILRSLPAWFGIEEAIVEYVHEVSQMPTFVAMILPCGRVKNSLGGGQSLFDQSEISKTVDAFFMFLFDWLGRHMTPSLFFKIKKQRKLMAI